MFYYFDPARDYACKKSILTQVSLYAPLDLSFYEDQHMFIYHNPKLKIYAGAFLKLCSAPEIPGSQILEVFQTPVGLIETFFFEVDNSVINECLDKFSWHYQHFLYALFEQLMNFSTIHPIVDLFTILDEEDYVDVNKIGQWPYEWINWKEDGKVLGYLKLDRSAYKIFNTDWIKRKIYNCLN